KKKVQPTKKRSSSENCTLQKRALQKVDRSEIIPVDTEHKSFVAINQETGTPWHFIFTDNTSHSLGTYASPYPTLLEAQNKAGANDALYVFPGSGAAYDTASSGDGGLQLKNNQRFLGSGTRHRLDSQYGPISIRALSSAMPILTNSLPQSSIINLSGTNNCEVAGFNFQGNEIKHAINGENIGGIYIVGNRFAVSSSTPGDAAIDITTVDPKGSQTYFPYESVNNVSHNLFTDSNKSLIKITGSGANGITTISNNRISNSKIDSTSIDSQSAVISINSKHTINCSNNWLTDISSTGLTCITLSTNSEKSAIIEGNNKITNCTATAGEFIGLAISTTDYGSPIESSYNYIYNCAAATNFYAASLSSVFNDSYITSENNRIIKCTANTDFQGWTASTEQGPNSLITFTSNSIQECEATEGTFYGWKGISALVTPSTPSSAFTDNSINACTAGTNFYGFYGITTSGCPVSLESNSISACTAGTNFHGFSGLSSGYYQGTLNSNSITGCIAGTDFYGWKDISYTGTGSGGITLSENAITFCKATLGKFYGFSKVYNNETNTETTITSNSNNITFCEAGTEFYGWTNIYSSESDITFNLEYNTIYSCTAGTNFYGWDDVNNNTTQKGGYKLSVLSNNQITQCTATAGAFYGFHDIAIPGAHQKLTFSSNAIQVCEAATNFYGWDALSSTGDYSQGITLSGNKITDCTAATDFYGWNVSGANLSYNSNEASNCSSTSGNLKVLTAQITPSATSSTISTSQFSTISNNIFPSNNSPTSTLSYSMDITYIQGIAACLTLTNNNCDASITVTNDMLETLTLDASNNNPIVTTVGTGTITEGSCSN
ncbi:MAG: hypothetical protein NTZ52_00800, partial [Chlamydiae bacterium]|nr:hypothetical protein [Chlamydiota bacterium]